MTGLTINWPTFSFWSFKAEEKPQAYEGTRRDDENQDLRRAYMTEMICAGACVGEFGAQTLMAVFPKDF